MTNSQLFLLMVGMPFFTALTVGVAAAWLTGDVRMFGVVGLIAAIVGGALMGYFEWRARLRKGVPEDAKSEPRAA